MVAEAAAVFAPYRARTGWSVPGPARRLRTSAATIMVTGVVGVVVVASFAGAIEGVSFGLAATTGRTPANTTRNRAAKRRNVFMIVSKTKQSVGLGAGEGHGQGMVDDTGDDFGHGALQTKLPPFHPAGAGQLHQQGAV